MVRRLAVVIGVVVLVWATGVVARTPVPSILVATDVEVDVRQAAGPADRAPRPARRAPQPPLGVTLLPVDPFTLEDDDNRLPLQLGDDPQVVASADGQLLAVAKSTGATEHPDVLEVVDSADWQVRARVEVFESFPHPLRILPGNDGLVWLEAHGPEERLVHVDLDDPTTRSEHRLPAGTWTTELVPLSGERVALLRGASDSTPEPEQQLLVLALGGVRPLMITHPWVGRARSGCRTSPRSRLGCRPCR